MKKISAFVAIAVIAIAAHTPAASAGGLYGSGGCGCVQPCIPN